jgi:hypothetical protein
MSTKIFWAYRTKNKNLSKLLKFIQKEQIIFNNKCINEVAENIAKYKIDIDNKDFLEKHLSKRNTVCYPFVKDLNVSLFSHNDGYTYIKLFGDTDNMNKFDSKLKKLNYIKEYEYQNQTDAPEKIGEKEYRKRGKKWDSFTERTGNFTDMLSIQIVPDFILQLFSFEFRNLINKYKKS